MIHSITGVPQLSLLEAKLLCHSIGVDLGYLSLKPPYFTPYRSERQIYFGPLRVMYIQGIEVFNQFADSMHEKVSQHLVLLNAAKSLLEEVEIGIHKDGIKPFLAEDLLAKMQSKPTFDGVTFLSKKKDIASGIMKSINKESMLGKLQTTFYRIKQVDERHRIQGQVYAYLVGSIKRAPVTDFPALDLLLNSSLCSKFVQAVSFAKREGSDKASEVFDIDRFELAFVLKRGGHDPDGLDC